MVSKGHTLQTQDLILIPEPIHKMPSIAEDIYSPRGQVAETDPWSSLTSQPDLLGDFQAKERLQKKKGLRNDT